MKKRTILAGMLILILSLFPATALAATEITIDLSGTLSTDTGYTVSGSTVTLTGGYDCRLTGSTNAYNIVVPAGAYNITLDNAGINTILLDKAAIHLYNGAVVNLTVEGDNTLQGGYPYGGIDVSAGTALTVTEQSTGKLTVTGGVFGAGIGSGAGSSSGTITINGGEICAYGGGYAAGIGGGDYGAAGAITINGGKITAYGQSSAAGIGGGELGAASTITINGGEINAYSGDLAAGIGGGYGGSGGIITITGGRITARGGMVGAGIGGGYNGGFDSITISGGTVYADGRGLANDIGAGVYGSGGIFGISGTAAVFLAHNGCTTPTTTTHRHETYTVDTEEAYGISIPAAWTPTFGAYLRLVDLDYNVNGGSGLVVGSVTDLYNSTTSVIDGDSLSLANYHFDGWNTAANGSGTDYAAGAAFTMAANTTLYAQWAPNTYTVQYNANGGTGTTAASSHTYDAAKALTANGFSREYYTFAGWATSASGLVIYTDEESVLNLTGVNGDTVTLYAKWRANRYTVQYDANGGTGTTAASSHTCDVPKTLTANGFSREYYTFAGWATSATGDLAYTDAGSVSNLTGVNGGTVTLYAKWTATPEIVSTDTDATVCTGGRFTLTPNLDGGTWDWDHSFFTATFNSPATFTALKAGTSTITYTVEGVSITYNVTIEASGLPATGQDMTGVWALCGAALILGVAAVLLLLRRKAAREKSGQ